MCYFNAVIFLTSGVESVIAYSVISHVTITQGVLNTENHVCNLNLMIYGGSQIKNFI